MAQCKTGVNFKTNLSEGKYPLEIFYIPVTSQFRVIIRTIYFQKHVNLANNVRCSSDFMNLLKIEYEKCREEMTGFSILTFDQNIKINSFAHLSHQNFILHTIAIIISCRGCSICSCHETSPSTIYVVHRVWKFLLLAIPASLISWVVCTRLFWLK